MGHPEPAVKSDRSHQFVTGGSLNTGCEHTGSGIRELLRELPNAATPDGRSFLLGILASTAAGKERSQFPITAYEHGQLNSNKSNSYAGVLSRTRTPPRVRREDKLRARPPRSVLGLQTGRQPR